MSPVGHVFQWLLLFSAIYGIVAFIRNHYHL